MLRPSQLLLLLLLASFAGGWFLWHAPVTEPSKAAVPAPTVAAPIPAAKPEEWVKAEKQAQLLREQVLDLQAQLKSLRAENSDLIDKLASLGLKNGSKGNALPMVLEPDSGAEDFVALGMELMVLRELQEPPVPTASASVEEVEALILASLKKQLGDDYGKREGAAFAALGLIPEPVDVLPLRAALLARLIGGWYDADQGTLKLVAPWPEEPVSGTAYALLQRRFSLGTESSKGKTLTTDERMARGALMGGDAALIRFLRDLKKFKGPNPNELPADDPDHPLNQVMMPAFLRELEVFPQTFGFKFAQTLHSVGGFKQVSAAYGRPPQSTSEVMHTERYLDDQHMPVPQIELPVLIGKAKAFWDDRLGKAATLAILKRFNTPEAAADAARGWQSDRLLAWHAPGSVDERGHAVWMTRWDTADDAAKFYDGMSEWLAHFYNAGIDKVRSGNPLNARSRTIQLLRMDDKQSVLLIDAATSDFAAQALQSIQTKH